VLLLVNVKVLIGREKQKNMRETLTEGAKIDRCYQHIWERNETRI